LGKLKSDHMKAILVAIVASISFGALALNPSRTYKQRPEKYNMEYKEVKVKTNDGAAELNTWYFPAKKKTTALVLIAHNGEGNMADYLRRIDQFRSAYNVVIFDYRGFGESSEFEIDHNMYIYPHFQDDMETMIDHCRKQYVGTFDIYGWGIGAGLGLGVGHSRPEVKRIIADTPFLSMEDLEERFESWDEPMEVPFAGYEQRHEPAQISDENLGKNIEKIQIIVGSNDLLFKSDDYKKLIGSSKKFNGIHVIENPDQKDNYKVDKTSYFKLISSVFTIPAETTNEVESVQSERN